MNRIALCLAILFCLASPSLADKGDFDLDALLEDVVGDQGKENPPQKPVSTPEPTLSPPARQPVPARQPDPIQQPAPDSGPVRQQPDSPSQPDIYILPEEPAKPVPIVTTPRGNVIPDRPKTGQSPVRPAPSPRPKEPGNSSDVSGTFVVFGLLAVVLIGGVAVAVAKSRRPSCPRCGALLKGGKCPLCQWPALLCDICQKEPLVDGICPHCGDSLPGHSEIRYNGGFDSFGRRAGGFGVVYKAIVRDGDDWKGGFMLKRSKTLRELNDAMVGMEEYKARRDGIVFEADVLEFLSKSGYRNAPPLLARGEIASGADTAWSGPWYLMETAVGTRLDAWMKSRSAGFSPDIEGRMLRALAEALVGLHKCGVAHRDFKPENVFWDEQAGRITLIDFGSASLPGKGNPMDGEKAPVSRFWAPPEQLVNRLGQNDAAADAYAFGVIFCAVVLGQERLEQDAFATYLGPVADKVGTPMARLVFGKLLGTDREARKTALAEVADALAGQKGAR